MAQQVFAGLFLACIGLTVLIGKLPVFVLCLYAGMSAMTYLAYALDKSAAMRGGQRVPEIRLHMLSLFGGWPGAASAQQRLRHKSVKMPFRAVFWLTVFVNVFVLLNTVH